MNFALFFAPLDGFPLSFFSSFAFSLPSEDAEVYLTLFFFRLDLSFLGTWDPATTVATSSAADSSWTSFSSSTSSPFFPLVAIAFLEAVIA